MPSKMLGVVQRIYRELLITFNRSFLQKFSLRKDSEITKFDAQSVRSTLDSAFNFKSILYYINVSTRMSLGKSCISFF